MAKEKRISVDLQLVKENRLRISYTEKDMAALLDCSLIKYTRFEKGQPSGFRNKQIEKICKILSIAV